MADFICLSMASQYSTDQNDTSVAVSASSSFRRSLNLSTGLLGRQFSRSISSAGGGGSVDNNSNNNNDNSDNSKKTMQVRIVPNIENPSRSLIFDVINRELQTGKVIKIGRFTDRVQASDHISFKSKVVSRSHCEIWLETDGKLYLRDTKSSSGTFLNHVRLSSANMESRPVEIRDGDIVQLGVDYQGGLNEIYRAVKMRFEINQTPQSNSFNVSAFNNLRQFTASSLVDPQTATCSDAHMTDKSCISNSDNSAAGGGEFQVDECCICLYALAPLQALFVAPCSHSYHFKCIRPLLQSYPGFQCPICRTYSDLEASVAIEPEEVAEKFGLQMGKQADRILDETNNETHQEQRHPLQQAQTTTTTPSPSAAAAETASSPPPPPPLVDTTAGVASNLLDDTLVLSPTNLSTGSEVELHTDQRRATIMLDEPFAQPQQQDQQRQQQQQQQQTTRSRGTLIAERRLSPANLVDKLKMAFSDKRKQPILVTKPNSRHNRPLSHPGRWRRDEDMDVDEDDEDGFNSDDQIAGSSSSSYASPSSSPPQRSPMHLARTLSRQSTNPLGNILEESIHT